MISFLRGNIVLKEKDNIVINVNGVGYHIQVPLNKQFFISDEAQIIYTYLYLREDRIVLYGFLTQENRNFFRLLLDTPGVGPKVAMNVISDMSPHQFKQAILNEDLKLINSVSGIGNKLAKKMILELKEKLKKILPIKNEEKNHKTASNKFDDAAAALKALGYSDRESKRLTENAEKKLKEKASVTLEDIIKIALKESQ
mgnify:CR=1 FL=1